LLPDYLLGGNVNYALAARLFNQIVVILPALVAHQLAMLQDHP